MDFLLFQIYAPMVSWGEIAIGEERQSSRHPSKSAIIGLISAALGIRRDEEERLAALSKSLGFAVQLYSAGTLLRDFQTAQVPKQEKNVQYYSRRAELLAGDDKVGTILSRREYRCDSLSVAAVYLKDDLSGISLEQIKEALNNPVFSLYFGRKSCIPALPLSPLLVKGSSLRDIFSAYKVHFPLPIGDDSPDWKIMSFEQYPAKLQTQEQRIYWETDLESVITDTIFSAAERYDQPLSRKRWQFSPRKENMTIVKENQNASF